MPVVSAPAYEREREGHESEPEHGNCEQHQRPRIRAAAAIVEAGQGGVHRTVDVDPARADQSPGCERTPPRVPPDQTRRGENEYRDDQGDRDDGQERDEQAEENQESAS